MGEARIIPEFEGVTVCRCGPLHFNIVWDDQEDNEDTGLCLWAMIGSDGKYISFGQYRVFNSEAGGDE